MNHLSNFVADYAYSRHFDVNHMYGKDLPYSFHLQLVKQIGEKYIHLIPEEDREIVRCALPCHDLFEDTHVTYNDLYNFLKKDCGYFYFSALYGNDVTKEKIHEVCTQICEIVFAVTNSKGRNRDERADDAYYQGIRNTKYATFVKLCDRIANVLYGAMFGTSQFEMYEKENGKFLLMLTSPELNSYEVIVADLDNLLQAKLFTF